MTILVGEVIAGVDTHADTHHAAVIDTNGKRLDDMKFPTTHGGYAALVGFITSFGAVIRVGVEGTGFYGVGLYRYLRDTGLEVVEAIRYLLVTRRNAVKARTATQIQIKTLLITAPEELLQRFRGFTDKAMIQGLARLRPHASDIISAVLKLLRVATNSFWRRS